MKLNVEALEGARTCDMSAIPEALVPKTDHQDQKSRILYAMDSATSLANSSFDDKKPETEQIIENVQVFENVPFVNSNECMQIDSNNLITITEDQLVKIEYQNASGLINTEYIVNEDIFNVHQEYANLVNVYPNGEGEESKDDKRHLLGIDDEDAAAQLLEMRHQSLLSPQSEDDNPSETDLTSLNWLHNITNIMSVPNLPTPPVSPKPKKKASGNGQKEDLTININFYKRNGDKKPPFSYATLICMAMGKNGNKMTLSAIYHWIRENFLYYRKAHPSWQVLYPFFQLL